MAESTGTAEVVDKTQLFEAWKDQWSDAQDPATRAAIQAAINVGYSPQSIPGGVGEMTQKFVDKEFEKIKEVEEKERERTPIEEQMDKYVEVMEKSDMKGHSHPKAEVMRERKDWSEIGWAKDKTEEVRGKLKANGFVDKHQVTNIVELSMATGQTAEEILQKFGNKPLDFNPTTEEQAELARAGRSREELVITKKRDWFSQLGISEKNIERFILEKEFHDKLETHDYQNSDPANIEEVAWQITHYKFTPGTWGVNDKFPILEMRLAYKKAEDNNGKILKDQNGKEVIVRHPDGRPVVDTEKSKYYISQSNFIRWARSRMWEVYDQSPDAALDFFSSINLPKSYRALDFGQMFQSFYKYFASEDKETRYGEMAQELLVEAAALGTVRSWDSAYKENMGDPKKLKEAVNKMFSSNALTKETFRKNVLNLMTIIPLNFEGTKEGELFQHDGIFGSAMLDMFLTYYNLTDFDQMKKIWGEGSSFFTKAGYVGAMQTVVDDKVKDSSAEHHATFLNAENQKYLDAAFDENGQVTSPENKQNFIKLINFFAVKMNNSDAEYNLRRLLYRAASEKYGKVLRQVKKDKITGEEVKDSEGNQMFEDIEEVINIDIDKSKPKNDPKRVITQTVKKYGLTADEEGLNNDEYSLKLIWVAASSMSRFFGAGARNDTKTTGYDFFNKLHLVQTYRNKMVNNNGEGQGVPGTIPQFKMLAVDPLNAIMTESNKYKKDENGNIQYDKEGKPLLQAKSTLEVFWEMQQLMSGQNLKLKQLERNLKEAKDRKDTSDISVFQEKIKKHKVEMSTKYQDKAGELAFKQRALSNYSDDHFNRAFETYDMITKAEEMNLDNYIQYDAWGGVRFNRAKFQQEVQDKMIHPIRYFLNTYPDLNYNKITRALDQTASVRQGHPVYRDMPLGEAMFGHELLNREAFWKKDPVTHKPILKTNESGQTMKGVYEIDYDKVSTDKGKVLLWKQFFMTKIAGDLWAHRSFHSTDSRFDLNYYKNVISAIESIPGKLEVDEYSLMDKSVTEKFFNKRDMARFKESVKVDNYSLYLRAIFKDMFLPDDPATGIGLLEALSLLTRQIVKTGG